VQAKAKAKKLAELAAHNQINPTATFPVAAPSNIRMAPVPKSTTSNLFYRQRVHP
jgi:hypothetical protein